MGFSLIPKSKCDFSTRLTVIQEGFVFIAKQGFLLLPSNMFNGCTKPIREQISELSAYAILLSIFSYRFTGAIKNPKNHVLFNNDILIEWNEKGENMSKNHLVGGMKKLPGFVVAKTISNTMLGEVCYCTETYQFDNNDTLIVEENSGHKETKMHKENQ